MKQRWNANTWALVILTGLVVIIGGETLRTYLYGDTSHPDNAKQEAAMLNPGFKVGDQAPDFTLPDAKGKKQELAAMLKQSKRDTLLCFICGCNNCRTMQKYIDQLNARLGDKAPQVISVTTMQPGAESGYRKDVKLAQTLLYEDKPLPGHTSTMDLYKGHPCPRIYRLGPDRKVLWIGPSISAMPIPQMAQTVAESLGFRSPTDTKNPSRPIAPPPPDLPGALAPPAKHAAAGVPGPQAAVPPGH